jgi:hypothetical protein
MARAPWTLLLVLVFVVPTRGVAGPPSHTACAVGIVAAVCLPANAARNFLSVQNLSATAVSCAFDLVPTAGVGTLLAPNGGAVWYEQPGTIPAGALQCIAVTGDGATALPVVATEQSE